MIPNCFSYWFTNDNGDMVEGTIMFTSDREDYLTSLLSKPILGRPFLVEDWSNYLRGSKQFPDKRLPSIYRYLKKYLEDWDGNKWRLVHCQMEDILSD